MVFLDRQFYYPPVGLPGGIGLTLFAGALLVAV